ncbi:MAG: penicillin-binding transpeptidase domain-containing protein [Gaiellaceae bacterium]
MARVSPVRPSRRSRSPPRWSAASIRSPSSNLSAPFAYGAWHVSTFEHTYRGVESVAAATIQSDNTVYARLALDVGPQSIVETARALGVRTSPLAPYPSLALGSEAVTPLEEASAYATLAAGGVYAKPFAITNVVLPRGRAGGEAGWGRVERERAVPDWVAATVTKVLELNMLAGTGRAAHVAGHADAGKTGTTDDYADAWFSGYTPRLEATVWMGYERAEIPMLDVHGIAASGPTFPAQIWHAFMTAAIGGRPNVRFAPPLTPPRWSPWRAAFAARPPRPQPPAGPPPAPTPLASTTTAVQPVHATTTASAPTSNDTAPTTLEPAVP